MSHATFLDSGPLGLITHPQYSSVEVVQATKWLSRSILAGSRVVVPAIVYFELKRELLRAQKVNSIRRLDEFVSATPDRYLALSDQALRLAAELWARARQEGGPTADGKALDIDVMIAAQALSSESAHPGFVVATTNRKHLSQFVPARHWADIVV